MDSILTENLIKLGMAVLVGGVIGAEREYQDKAAGFRTIILITVGSALFTIFSVSMDPGFTRTRVAANIVTGIGFLGAGAIIREGGRITGLTTAATIWLSAALGMGIGAGELMFVAASTGAVLFILLVFPAIEKFIDRIRESRNYRIVLTASNSKVVEQVQQLFESHSLNIVEHHQTKSDGKIVGTWRVIGKPKHQDEFLKAMLKDKNINEISY